MGTPTIGVLSAFLDGFFHGDVVAAIDAVARVNGARMLALATAQPWAKAWTQTQLCNPHFVPIGWEHVDGIIVIAPALPAEHNDLIAKGGKPVVTISMRNPLSRYPSILPDNHGGAMTAVQHLIGHGHAHIAFAGWLGQDDVRLRCDGYRAALEQRDIRPDPSLVFATANNNREGGREAAAAILAAGIPCSAVMAGTDLCAIGLMEAFQEAGYRVPEDLAVVGFDDIAMARHSVPSLTTMAQRFGVLGTAAAEYMLAAIAGKPVPSGPVQMPTMLVCRRSCGCVEHEVEPPQAENPLTVADWPTTVTASIARLVLSPLRPAMDADPELLWPGVGTVVAAIDALARRSPAPPRDVTETAWKAACLRVSGPEEFDVLIEQVRQSALERLSLLGCDTRAARRRVMTFLDDARSCVDRYSLLSGIWGRRTSVGYNHLTYLLSTAMFGPSNGGAADLLWARHTAVQRCCLGLWDDEPDLGGRRLVVTSTDIGNEERPPDPGQPVTPVAFPPREFLNACAVQGSPQTVLVLPLSTPEREWGYLAVVGPEDPSSYFGESDTLRSVPALLTVALEHEALGRELARQQQYFRALVEQSTDLILVIEPNGIIRYASPSHERVLGLRASDLVGIPVTSLVSVEDASSFEASLASVMRNGGILRLGELGARHIDGTARTLEMFANNRLNDQAVRGIILNSRDVTARKRAEALLEHQAFHDSLTGLPNRTLFNDRLDRIVRGAQREQSTFSMCLLDLDHFKEVNDTLGHWSGDRLLQEVATRLLRVLRGADTAARLGGDEFALLLPQSDVHASIAVVRRVLDALAEPWSVQGRRVGIVGSIGIAVFPQHGNDAEALIDHADAAMYSAKETQSGYAVYGAVLERCLPRTRPASHLHLLTEAPNTLSGMSPVPNV